MTGEFTLKETWDYEDTKMISVDEYDDAFLVLRPHAEITYLYVYASGWYYVPPPAKDKPMSNYIKYAIIFASINVIAALTGLGFKYWKKRETQKKAEITHVDSVRPFEVDKSTNKSYEVNSPEGMHKKSKDIENEFEKYEKGYHHSNNAIEPIISEQKTATNFYPRELHMESNANNPNNMEIEF